MRRRRLASPPGYITWLNAVLAAGATPTSTDTTTVKATLASMKAYNFLLAELDYIYVAIGSNPSDTSTNRYNQKRINLVNPGTFNAIVYNPNDSGHASNGTLGNKSMYWDTGYNSSTRAVNRTNAASWGEIIVSLGTGPIPVDGGWEDGGNTGYMQPYYPAGSATVFAYGGGSGLVPVITAPYLYYSNVSGGIVEGFANTTSKTTSSAGTRTVGTRSIYHFGVNSAGSAVYKSDCVSAMTWHGRNFNSTDRANWYAIWRDHVAAYSVAI